MKFAKLLVLPVLFLASCGINRQVKQIKALENCTYAIVSADSIFVVRQDVTQMVKSKTFDMSRIPALALAYLRKDIPFEARINLQIDNPSSALAAINRFEYQVYIKDQQLASGFVDQKVEVPPGGSTRVPVKVRSNVYAFLSNGKTMQEITDFITGGSSGATEKKSMVTIKFKPTIQSGNKLITYPGWITIDKELSSKILF